MAGRHRADRAKVWPWLFFVGYALLLTWAGSALFINSYQLPPQPEPVQSLQLPPFEAKPTKPPSIDRTPLPNPVKYKSCTQVAELKKLPLLKGQPGYRKGLDSDGDGKACENYY